MNMKGILIGLTFTIAMLHSQNCFSQNMMEDICISHCNEGSVFVKRGHKPNKAPANIPFKACVSREECKIYIYSSSDTNIEYYVCDSNNTTLLSGCDKCNNSTWTPISLDYLPCGTYTIFIVANGYVYRGDLNI